MLELVKPLLRNRLELVKRVLEELLCRYQFHEYTLLNLNLTIVLHDLIFHLSAPKLWPTNTSSENYACRSGHVRISIPKSLRLRFVKDLAFCLGSIAFCLLKEVAFCQCPVASRFAQHLRAYISLPACITSSFPCEESTFFFLEFDEVLRSLSSSDADKDRGVFRLETSLPLVLHTIQETYENTLPENHAYIDVEAEAIHMILSEIRDEIYSICDACKTTQEMWRTTERLQQGESLNKQDVKTNLFWEFGKFTSKDRESIESYYSRFYKMMNEMQQHKLDEVSYHKLFDILKQYQKEVNKLCAERLARNANPLALVATAQANQDQYYQTSKSYAPSSKPSIPTRSHTTTRYQGKEIVKLITPPSGSASEEDSDHEQAQRDKDMQKNSAFIAKYFKKIYKPTNNNLRTSSNSRNKNVDTTPQYKNDNQSGQFRNQRTINVVGARENVGSPVVQQSGIQCFNCMKFGHFAKECKNPKRVKDSAYHKKKMLLCKQAEKGVPFQAEQYDWLADTDEKIDE
nr:hypothetical protein [Tanacetum cinerariifolium]